MKTKIIFIITILISVCFLIFSLPAKEAASECKGLIQTECEANSNCVWVKGYTTKKGTKVKSYCRSKPKKKEKEPEKTKEKEKK